MVAARIINAIVAAGSRESWAQGACPAEATQLTVLNAKLLYFALLFITCNKRFKVKQKVSKTIWHFYHLRQVESPLIWARIAGSHVPREYPYLHTPLFSPTSPINSETLFDHNQLQ